MSSRFTDGRLGVDTKHMGGGWGLGQRTSPLAETSCRVVVETWDIASLAAEIWLPVLFQHVHSMGLILPLPPASEAQVGFHGWGFVLSEGTFLQP